MNLAKTQAEWDPIITLDPLGMTTARPTISATTAVMHIPELQLEPDGSYPFSPFFREFARWRPVAAAIFTLTFQ